jgi:hypothetical protein
MYIRTKEDALDAVAEVLELPERREQIVQSTVKIMLCLEVEPRMFMADCQALLIEGGLEAMRVKRRDLLDSIENIPIVIVDPEEDRLFEEAASALDALRLSEVVRQVFPPNGHVQERWMVARALLGKESVIQESLAAAIRGRGDAEQFEKARLAVEALVMAHRPDWAERSATMRRACRDVLEGAELCARDRLEEETDLVFGAFAIMDAQAAGLLEAVDNDPQEAVALVTQMHGLVQAVRSVQSKSLSGPDTRAVTGAA